MVFITEMAGAYCAVRTESLNSGLRFVVKVLSDSLSVYKWPICHLLLMLVLDDDLTKKKGPKRVARFRHYEDII